MPIVPMVLINGAEGIGTGWSTTIPCFHPLHIVDNIKHRLMGGSGFKRMTPWFKGY
jgi:DNA topoisomerase-2